MNMETVLQRIDGKGYKAYQDLVGTYTFEQFTLHIDYVQPDPFANPSRMRVIIPRCAANILPEWTDSAVRRTALTDFLARQVAAALAGRRSKGGGSGKSGLLEIDAPGQEVLLRTAVAIDEESIDIRLSAGLPAAGRRILARQAQRMLGDDLPAVIRQSVGNLNPRLVEEHLQLAENQQAIREHLRDHGLICFVNNGAILPRVSGVSNRPLPADRAVLFKSPPEMEVTISLPHGQPLCGMGIKAGITLIAGGGYHGKSTLLAAIERGVYNHVAGDGREYVISDETACKIRAEDGRRVEKVNISPFIANLPLGKDTTEFSSEDASGSTSQAANIMEMLEAGSRVLLMDEDTSATNFLIRDARMQSLVAKDKEPITPFIDKVRLLYEQKGVSTIMVLGGSGDYFDVADRVIMMDEYRPLDVTDQAQKVAAQIPCRRNAEGGSDFGEVTARIPAKHSFQPRRGNKEKVEAKGLHTILYGTARSELAFVEQLVDASQTRSIARALKTLAERLADDQTPLSTLLDNLYAVIEQDGLEAISPYRGKHPGDLALPRRFEVAAAINRLQSLKIKA
ncbi:ABC-ATPase domain-containing protein [Dethiobacter alkaliphilus]|uniref:ATPase n=1 Tax=Dethiobacter alkaliphilus AHT 1 TaxID=555088 RepID=C0GIC0_DETAL|nr:ABC-ATPase domain-containing protein [Dethiobacter alkaliphilus]EEG76968.1 ATPase [Dethiobacter alkaliphilus AHT 1]